MNTFLKYLMPWQIYLRSPSRVGTDNCKKARCVVKGKASGNVVTFRLYNQKE